MPQKNGLRSHSQIPDGCYDHPVVILSARAASVTDDVSILIVRMVGFLEREEGVGGVCIPPVCLPHCAVDLFWRKRHRRQDPKPEAQEGLLAHLPESAPRHRRLALPPARRHFAEELLHQHPRQAHHPARHSSRLRPPRPEHALRAKERVIQAVDRPRGLRPRPRSFHKQHRTARPTLARSTPPHPAPVGAPQTPPPTRSHKHPS